MFSNTDIFIHSLGNAHDIPRGKGDKDLIGCFRYERSKPTKLYIEEMEQYVLLLRAKAAYRVCQSRREKAGNRSEETMKLHRQSHVKRVIMELHM